MPQTQTYVDAPLSADASKGSGFVDVQPGSERTRPDTNILGVDHEKLRQSITDWAATSPHVPESLRVAAAKGGTYFGDVLASLAELFSSPEGAAAGVAKAGGIDAMDTAIQATKNAAAKVPQAAIRGTAAIGDAVHPDVIGVISPRAGKVVNVAQRMRDKMPQPEAATPPRTPSPGVMARPAPKALPPGPIIPPPPADSSFVRSVPAEPLPGGQYASSPGPAFELAELLMQREAPQPPAAPKPSIPNLTKADQARITALDREVGATETGRALRHDPRFKTMKPADRTAAIRSVSTETPGALPMQARRSIDDFLSKLSPADRVAEIQRGLTDPKTGAAVRRYLQTLVQPQ